MKKHLHILVLCLFFFSACSTSGQHIYNTDDSIDVVVPKGDHYSIIGDSFKTIKRGENVSFGIKIDDGYEFDENESEGKYNDGVYSISNIQYSKTLGFHVSKKRQLSITVYNDTQKGTISIEPKKEFYNVGDEITISCVENDDNRFISYSYNDFSHDYTRSAYITTTVPFSFSKEFTTTLKDNLILYVNYFREGSYLLTYHGNGGTTTDGKNTIVSDFFPARDYYLPNTLQGSRYFYKPGYILESWNTKEDGSGTRIGLGSLVRDVADIASINLYAHWVKETSASCFSVAQSDNGYEIVGYDESKNKDNYLAIPREINGEPVRSIGSNSIITSKQQLILSDNIRVVCENAIIGNNVAEIVFFNSLKKYENEALHIPNCKTCFINGAAFSTNREECIRDLTRRFEEIKRSQNNNDQQLFILVGHSTLFQNHNLSPLAEAFPDYNFQLFGATMGTSTKVMLDLANILTKEDDVMLFQMHETAVASKGDGYDTLARFDLNYDLFSLLDFREYQDIFYTSYNECAKLFSSEFGIDIYNYETAIPLSERGESVSMGSGDYNVPEDNVGPSVLSIPLQYCNHNYYSNIINMLNKSPAGNIIITWSTYNKNAIISLETFSLFESVIREDFSNFTFIDSIKDNVYSGNCFCVNDNNHLNLFGGDIRIKRWAELLKAIL